MSEKTKFKLSPENKRKLIFLPIIILIGGSFFYLAFSPTEKKGEKKVSYEYELPNAENNEMSDEKLDVLDNLKKENQRKKDKLSAGFRGDFDDLYSGENKEIKPKEEKNINDLEAIKKIQAQLIANENKQKNVQKKYNTSRRNTTNKTPKVSVVNEKDKINEWKKETDDDFDDFFNTNVKPNPKYNQKEVVDNTNTKNKFIDAYISGDQEKTNGSIIILRLANDTEINGRKYEMNTSFFGVLKLQKNRAKIFIDNINHNPVSLNVFDKRDGLEGIYIEGGNFSGDLKTIAKDETIDNIETSGSGIANGAINSVKNVLRKKTKLDKALILNNTKVILK